MQIPYTDWRSSLHWLERIDTPDLRPNLLEYSLLVAFVGAVIVGLLWGRTGLELKVLSISEGSKFLYLKFDVTDGNTYMFQLLDEIGITQKNANL